MDAPEVYDPVGYCIYCGSKEGTLSAEHIVAYALGGKWILPRASCEECGKMTSKTETVCLGAGWGMLYDWRAKYQMPSQRIPLSAYLS